MLGFSFGLVQMALYCKYKNINANKISKKQKLPETILTQVIVMEEPKNTEQMITIVELNEGLNLEKNRVLPSQSDEIDDGVEGSYQK